MTTHMLFSASTAWVLALALPAVGGRGEVIGLPDCLSFGPIDPPDTTARLAWMADKFGRAEEPAEIDAFWGTATAADADPVGWLGRRPAQDYAGLLEFVRRVGDRPCRIVDETEIVFCPGDDRLPTLTFAIASSEDLMAAGLPDRAEPFDPARRGAFAAEWDRLRREDAPLRIIADGRLVSAPETVFDAELVAAVGADWTACVNVIGRVMADQLDTPYLRTDGAVLWWRLRTLIAAGAVDGDGDFSTMKTSRVRLP